MKIILDGVNLKNLKVVPMSGAGRGFRGCRGCGCDSRDGVKPKKWTGS